MKHMNCIRPALLVLAAIVALGGCNAGGVSSSGGSTTPSSTTMTTTATTTAATTTVPTTTAAPVSTILVPDPVTGIYNGQTITLRYKAITDYLWAGDMSPAGFYNGMAIFFYMGTVGHNYYDYSAPTNTFAYMDPSGHVINDRLYHTALHFNEDGKALAQRASDSTWVFLDKAGKETECSAEAVEDEKLNFPSPPSPQDKEGFIDGLKAVHQEDSEQKNIIVNQKGETVAVLPNEYADVYIWTKDFVLAMFGNGEWGEYIQLYNTSGKLLNETKFDRIGKFYNGLAPFLIDGKLGILDDKGQIVIPASFEVDNTTHDNLNLREDLILVNKENRICILEITRS